MNQEESIEIHTTEMHCSGEPLRIIEKGYPEIVGETILDKRRYCKEKLDHLRKQVMWEPRGHYDMYGALKVTPDHPDADLAVLFMHNEGYSTMCGHAIMCLGRYVVDRGLQKAERQSPLTPVNIQCPCGLVRALVEYDGKKTNQVQFRSVPAFAFALDYELDVPEFGKLTLDIGYGGAFYLLLPASAIGLDVKKSKTSILQEAAGKITDAGRAKIKISHPTDADLAFLYGTILTDGNDAYSEVPTANMCVFAEREVDRSPCGSGVTARCAVQFAKGLVATDQARVFEGPAGGRFTGTVVEKTECGEREAVIIQVQGKGNYLGTATFTSESDDPLTNGFLLN